MMILTRTKLLIDILTTTTKYVTVMSPPPPPQPTTTSPASPPPQAGRRAGRQAGRQAGRGPFLSDRAFLYLTHASMAAGRIAHTRGEEDGDDDPCSREETNVIGIGHAPATAIAAAAAAAGISSRSSKPLFLPTGSTTTTIPRHI
jgi:hypothetical protein